MTLEMKYRKLFGFKRTLAQVVIEDTQNFLRKQQVKNMTQHTIQITDIGKEIKTCTNELESYRNMLRKVTEELVDWRQHSWPGRVKTNEVIRLEQSEINLKSGIDSLQKKLVQLNKMIK